MTHEPAEPLSHTVDGTDDIDFGNLSVAGDKQPRGLSRDSDTASIAIEHNFAYLQPSAASSFLGELRR